MYIIAFILTILSVVVTYVSQNLFLNNISLGLAIIVFGISAFSSFKKRKSLKNLKFAKITTWVISICICILGFVPIYYVIADKFGQNTIVITDTIRNYNKPSSHNGNNLLYVGEIYIGDSPRSYIYSLKNPDVTVLKESKNFLDQEGSDVIFRITVTPYSGYILKAEIVSK